MGADYLKLSVSDFLDVISGLAGTREYTVFWPGGTWTDTLQSLREGLNYYPKNYDIWDIAPRLEEISKEPIHQYETLSKVQIYEYIGCQSGGFDTDKLDAIRLDVIQYCDEHPDITKCPNILYLNNLINKKADNQPQLKGVRHIPQYTTKKSQAQLEALFASLNKAGYIASDTDESSFIWALGGEKCPEPFMPIKRTKTVSTYAGNLSKISLFDLLNTLGVSNHAELTDTRKYKALFQHNDKPLKMTSRNITDANNKNWISENHAEIKAIIENL